MEHRDERTQTRSIELLQLWYLEPFLILEIRFTQNITPNPSSRSREISCRTEGGLRFTAAWSQLRLAAICKCYTTYKLIRDTVAMLPVCALCPGGTAVKEQHNKNNTTTHSLVPLPWRTPHGTQGGAPRATCPLALEASGAAPRPSGPRARSLFAHSQLVEGARSLQVEMHTVIRKGGGIQAPNRHHALLTQMTRTD